MYKSLNKLVLIITLISAVSACGTLKQAGKDIGHTTKKVTKDIGHASRDAAKEMVKTIKEN
jgi:predicted small secreted protein